jgi:hypothetical protein
MLMSSSRFDSRCGNSRSFRLRPYLESVLVRAPASPTSSDPLLSSDTSGRLIIVGDIHGMRTSLQDLLTRVKFDAAHDVLLPVGDMLTKGGVDDSLAVLDLLMAHGARPVRGNQDQPVIEWHAWQGWVESLDEHARLDQLDDDPNMARPLTGARWLRALDRSFAHRPPSLSRELWLEAEHAAGPRHFWRRVPAHLADDMFSQAYLVARRLRHDQFEWLRQTPSAIHVPDLHTFVVHAGLLPTDVTRPMRATGQPLATTPRGRTEDLKRRAQEDEVLDGKGIRANRELWTRTRLRSVRANKTLSSKREEGTYWADVWADVVGRCRGFPAGNIIEGDDMGDDDTGRVADTEAKRKGLSCMPMTVVYAHTAVLGLDLRRWTLGLDSGCVRTFTLSLSRPLICKAGLRPGTLRAHHRQPECEHLYQGARADGVRRQRPVGAAATAAAPGFWSEWRSTSRS